MRRRASSGLLWAVPALWIVLTLACACARGPTPTPTPAPFPEDPLVRAALDTVVRFNQARTDMAGDTMEVPAEYWAPEIAALEPRAVYWHNYNLVVVLPEADAEVDGLYIYVPISSYMPPEETFELPIGQESYRLDVIR